jgi:hypothetical protein
MNYINRYEYLEKVGYITELPVNKFGYIYDVKLCSSVIQCYLIGDFKDRNQLRAIRIFKRYMQ